MTYEADASPGERPADQEQTSREGGKDLASGSAEELSERDNDDLSPEAGSIQDDPSLNPEEDMLKDIKGG